MNAFGEFQEDGDWICCHFRVQDEKKKHNPKY